MLMLLLLLLQLVATAVATFTMLVVVVVVFVYDVVSQENDKMESSLSPLSHSFFLFFPIKRIKV